MELRPYQEKAKEKAVEFFNSREDGRPIVVAPTGSGKSFMIAAVADALESGVLVLQPSKELLEQNYGKYRLYGGTAGIYSASAGSKNIEHVTFATIGSLKNKAGLFDHVKNIVIDECHLVPPKEDSMYIQFLSQMTGAKVLGLTATAFRLKTYRDRFTREKFSQVNLLNRERPMFFNSFLHVTQIGELYEQGYLCPVRYAELNWEDGELRYNTTGAEYSDESMEKAIMQQKIYERVPNVIAQSIEKGRKHRLVFVRDVYHAAFLTSKVPNSAAIHSGTPQDERERILTEFRKGNIGTVFNVSVLTTGFDFAELDTIIIARPTMSLVLYMQMVGRGMRPAAGKEDCVVVDMCGNYKRFGELHEIRYETDAAGKWFMRNKDRVLSGVRI